MCLSDSAELHGEPFNFGPPADQNYSVASLVNQISQHWDQVRWQDVSQDGEGPYESGLLKLNCDKALHHLKWRAIWNFEQTVQELLIGIERSMSNLSRFLNKQKGRLLVISRMQNN